MEIENQFPFSNFQKLFSIRLIFREPFLFLYYTEHLTNTRKNVTENRPEGRFQFLTRIKEFYGKVTMLAKAGIDQAVP